MEVLKRRHNEVLQSELKLYDFKKKMIYFVVELHNKIFLANTNFNNVMTTYELNTY